MDRQIYMRTVFFSTISTVGLVAVLAACGSGERSSEPSIPDTTAPRSTSTSLGPTTSVSFPFVGPDDLIEPMPPPGDLKEATQQAVDDLAARTRASREDIEVATAEDVTWNDGSLGCPEPGKMYTQALVPGLRVILTLDGQEYAYHAAEGRKLFYCASPDETPSTDL